MNGKVRMMQTLGRFRDGIVRAFQTDRVVSTEADFIVALTSKNVGTIRLADNIVLRKPLILTGAYNTVIDGGGRFGFIRGRKNTANYLFDLQNGSASDIAFVGVSFTLGITGKIFVADSSTSEAIRLRLDNVDTDQDFFGTRTPGGIKLVNVEISVRNGPATLATGNITADSTYIIKSLGLGATYSSFEQTGQNNSVYLTDASVVISAEHTAAMFVVPISGSYFGEFSVLPAGSSGYFHTKQTQVAPTLHDVTVSGSNPTIDVKHYTTVRVQDDGTASGNASLTAGIVTGHQVLLIFEGSQGYSIPSTGTFKSHSNFNPSDHDTLLAVWNASHNHWLEVSRSNN